MSPLRPLLPLALIATPALAEPPSVMTDIPPVHALASSVMGDLAAPGILLDQGSDPHHFQLRPSQARALSDADLVFWVGPRMTPWLGRAIEGVGLQGEAIALIDLPETHRQNFGEAAAHDHDHDDHDAEEHAHEDVGHDDHTDEHAHEETGHDDHADEHAHEEAGHDDHAEHAEDDHGHSHSGLDPHAWLDPANARAWTRAIAARLSAADPENAAIYAANADATLAAIDAAEAEVREILAPVGDAPVMVFHDAYGYYAAHFGVNVAGSIALGDAANPGAARLSALRDHLREDDIACIFPEAQHDPAYVAAIVEGTGTRVGAALDPSGSTLEYGPALYGTLLTGLARDIAECVGQE
ncbi:zinc ABC transporter substrate-binding protein [Rhodovulum adriaticum]|uniref:High-affinity zinc uptake system protein ZnuA n=1 Tax=Rhodovulum adriaticum TaxID=35804 RepID=A0A4R2NKN4_RHOAD|nr:zinc ABC transporter substrate-binding protein [Rhodovulum adriaticum]MBK1635488.1 zinc ABC transporter substrate-binding protein [Rhodovulum adriaticum]TCP22060.1 zinc transport system substrate-binding protein [Rhodovulum adriaticum]